MNSIQFESAREKEKIRQEIRAVREQMLEKAQRNAEEREKRRAQGDWMLPAIAEKLESLDKKSLKKTHKREKKEKKSKSKKNKKAASDTLSEDSNSDEEKPKKSRKKSKKQKKKSNRSESSSEEEAEKRHAKHKKKSKKSKKEASSSATSSDAEEASSWLAKPSVQQEPMQRDSWMTSPFMLKTFSREHAEIKPNAAQQQATYDPAKNARELNPYWKTTGTGLPAFKKPRDESDEEKSSQRGSGTSHSRGWQKKTTQTKSHMLQDSDVSSSSETEEPLAKQLQKESSPVAKNSLLNDEQLNELGAKILKAELTGNTKLAEDLKEQLENARLNRSAHKNIAMQKRTEDNSTRKRQEGVLLTHSDVRGNSRPLAQTRGLMAPDKHDMWGGRSAKKSKRTPVQTHAAGERVRYFADDDKYDIKQMVN